LDNQYTVFGQVISGLEIIDSIAAVRTGAGDRPMTDVLMTMEVIR
jgi:peptidyl-prolyl cis-trans isomerase B (cyclophilin B)